MKQINEIDIKITKAVVTAVKISLDEDGVNLEVSGDLISDTKRKVTSFSYSSDAWQGNQKIKIPSSIHLPARKLFEIAQPLVIEKIQGHFKALPSGRKKHD